MQSGIKYSALLNDAKGSVVDEKVFDETLVLGEGQTVHKSIVYTPATSLPSGKYKLWIRSQNSSGLPLGLASVGDVSIQRDQTVSSGTYYQILVHL